jgi:hypothetical protein
MTGIELYGTQVIPRVRELLAADDPAVGAAVAEPAETPAP